MRTYCRYVHCGSMYLCYTLCFRRIWLAHQLHTWILTPTPKTSQHIRAPACHMAFETYSVVSRFYLPHAISNLHLPPPPSATSTTTSISRSTFDLHIPVLPHLFPPTSACPRAPPISTSYFHLPPQPPRPPPTSISHFHAPPIPPTSLSDLHLNSTSHHHLNSTSTSALHLAPPPPTSTAHRHCLHPHTDQHVLYEPATRGFRVIAFADSLRSYVAVCPAYQKSPSI